MTATRDVPDQGRVVIYDPNAFNPYGAEVAAVLTEAGFRVTRWCRLRDPFAFQGCRRRPVLWASRQQVGMRLALLSRGWGTALFLLANIASRRPIVFTWLLSVTDMLVALALLSCGRTVIVVDHNPLPERRLAGRRELLMERVRKNSVVRVVHSQYLAERNGGEPCEVVAHPSYRRWIHAHDAKRRQRGKLPPRALFLGALRRDKGSHQLGALVGTLLERRLHVTVAGRGELVGPEWKSLGEDPRVVLTGITRSLSDDEVARALRTSDVLIAPYADVTMSGSIVMALSAGVPVAAYDSPALRDVVPADFLVGEPDLDRLAERAAHLTEMSDSLTCDAVAESLDRACARDWARILTRYCRSRR